MEASFLLALLLAVGSLAAKPMTQEHLDYIGSNLDVKVKVTDNVRYSGMNHVLLVTLTNTGSIAMETNGLQMYFYSFFMVEPDFLPHPDGFVSAINNVTLYHVDGMLFYADFLPIFGQMAPGESRTLSILVKDWAVARSDVLPNWYVMYPGLSPRVLNSTAGDGLGFVEPFLQANQWKRYADDVYDPLTTRQRFDRITWRDLGRDAVRNKIIPTPRRMVVGRQDVVVDDTWRIVSSPDLGVEAEFLSSALGLRTSIIPRAFKVIVLWTAENPRRRNKEWYRLRSIPSVDIISIFGRSKAGVFNGIQSLLALHSQTQPKLRYGEIAIIPQVIIVDQPRFPYRGQHLDVARNFHPKETVMKLIDIMSTYKLNKLHLHLSDDEGWRLHIPELPQLTEVGADRCHDLKERVCIHPQLGSGPFSMPPGSGFYTPEDYKTILRHAARHHVEVIPEFTFPAHSHAAIKSMKERHRQTKRKDFILEEPNDTSRYMSVQMFPDDVVNPCLESTYNFISTVVRRLKRMHAGISPLKTFHFGGEEAPAGAWLNSTHCRAKFPGIADSEFSSIVKAYFLYRLAEIVVTQEGLNLAAYEDGYVIKGMPIPNGSSKTLAFTYQNVWEWGYANRAYEMANNDYPVVLTPVTHLSFDHPYEAHPEESGLYWATRFTTTHKVFTLRPENLYLNIDVMRSGKRINRMEVCGVYNERCDKLKRPDNIKGIQGLLWSELIRTREQLEKMAFPRVLAMAERAWHKAKWESKRRDPDAEWELFANQLGYNELPRLDNKDVHYRVPPPGGRVTNNEVTVKSKFPGLFHQYSIDNGATWEDYTVPFQLRGPRTILLRTLTPDRRRFSRVVRLPTFAGTA